MVVMDEPLRVDESRISRSSLFWLVLLLVANLTAIYSFWPSSTPELLKVQSDAESAEPLILIDELDETERMQLIRENRSESPEPDSELTPRNALVCRAWGPFSDLADVEALQARIADVGSAIEVRTSEIDGDPDYLVYIDTGNNLDTARRTRIELESQSVESYIIAGGPYLNSVSVGVFSRPDRAQSQRERVSALGYDSRVQELVRSQTVYHLIARVPENTVESQMKGIDRGAECGTIASVQ
jgi:hypothetical protein